MATAANTVEKIQQFSYNTGNNTTVFSTDLRVQGNLTVVGGHVIAQTSTLIVQDNIITLNAFIGQSQTPVSSAGIEIDRGNQPNVSLMWIESEGAWKFTSDGITYDVLGGGSAGAYANGAFEKANSAGIYANGAFAKVNAVYQYANSTSLWGMRQAFIATPGQTTFSPGSGYVPGQVDVFYNGIKLYGTEDFTATDGVNVILTNPAGANAIVEVVGFGGNIAASNVYVLNSMASLLNRQTFIVPVHGQTVFTPSTPYRAGYVDVYYNGLKMVIPDDVVANNGTHIYFVGLTPTTNDVIEIVGLTPNVALANAIPITGGSVSGGLTLAGNVLPETTNTYYLGSETKRWHSLYVGPGSIDLGGLILSNSGGTLAVSTPGSPATPIAGEDTWVRAQANAAFAAANNVAPQIQPAFDRANAAFAAANNVAPQIQPAFDQANAAFILANGSISYGANTTNTSFVAVPIGTTAQRPANSANGALRYNTTLGQLEVYMPSSGWIGIIKDLYTVEILMVGGGGGGGFNNAGGGGAGGLIFIPNLMVFPGNTYAVTIGAGGAGIPDNGSVSYAPSGSNTTLVFGATSLNALGGGGSSSWTSAVPGKSGGSGSGASANPGGTTYPGGSGTQSTDINISADSRNYGFGNSGGSGAAAGGGDGGGGGGGGAGGTGSNGSTTGSSGPGGAGGIGKYYSQFTTMGGSPAGWYAGGGGGGGGGGAPGGTGGQGGGGPGAVATVNATNGTVNTGGGAGGGDNSLGGTGGSGILLIRYLGVQRASGGTVSYDGTYTYHKFTGSGSFTA